MLAAFPGSGSRSGIVAGRFPMWRGLVPWNRRCHNECTVLGWIGRIFYEVPARIFLLGCRAVSIRLWCPSLTSV